MQPTPWALSALQLRLPAMGSPQYWPLGQPESAWHSSAAAQMNAEQRPVAHWEALVHAAPWALSALQVRLPRTGSPQYWSLAQPESSAQFGPPPRLLAKVCRGICLPTVDLASAFSHIATKAAAPSFLSWSTYSPFSPTTSSSLCHFFIMPMWDRPSAISVPYLWR